MRTTEQLIIMARKLSRNERYDSNSGVPQDVFVQYLNNAQDTLIKEITNLKTKFFKKQLVIDVVANQEKYSYPDDCIVQHIETIQWTDTISGTYWQTLYKSYTKEKITLQPGYPFAYIPYNDGFYLNPPIVRGKLWIAYETTVPKAQKRAGLIQSVTINSGVLQAMTLNTTDATYDENEINSDFYMCIVDKYGAVKARNIPYNSITGGVFNINNYTLASTDSISVGDYILVGKNTCNVPEFPDICESFILKHMVYDAKYSDGSTWSQEAKDDMMRSFALLSGVFATNSDDITQVPIVNLDFIGF